MYENIRFEQSEQDRRCRQMEQGFKPEAAWSPAAALRSLARSSAVRSED
jgi:hypothetical protein